jgi:hypothetical protein
MEIMSKDDSDHMNFIRKESPDHTGCSTIFSISPWEHDPTQLGIGLVSPDCPNKFCYENNVHRPRPPRMQREYNDMYRKVR